MRKVDFKIEMDLDTGEYEVIINSRGHKDVEEMEAHELKDLLEQIFVDWAKNLEHGIDSDDCVTKVIH